MIIETRNISKKSLFEILLVGLGLGSLLFWLLLSVLSVFVSGSVGMSFDSTKGLAGFTETLLVWPFFAVFWVGFTWLFLVPGLAIINRFAPLQLKTKDSRG